MSQHGLGPLFGVFLFLVAIEAMLAAALYQVTRNYLGRRNRDTREARNG